MFKHAFMKTHSWQKTTTTMVQWFVPQVNLSIQGLCRIFQRPLSPWNPGIPWLLDFWNSLISWILDYPRNLRVTPSWDILKNQTDVFHLITQIHWGGYELFFHTLHSLERGYPYHCCEWWKQDKPDPLMVPAHWSTDGKPDPLHNKMIKIKSLQIIQSLYCILNSLESDHRFRLSDALKVEEHKMPHRLVKKHMLTCPENLDFLLL